MIGALALLGAAFLVGGPARVLLRMLSMPLHRTGWRVWLTTFNGVALVAVAALPLAAAAAWALARRRRARGVPAAWRMSLAEVGIVHGTAPWVWITMLPGSDAGAVPGRVSLVPLRDLHATLAAGSTFEVVGNLLVFAALGLLAPLRFAALASLPRVLALAAGCSVLIETAQYVLRLDRVSSVDDVLLNAAGAGLAALASRPWWRAGTAAAGAAVLDTPAIRADS